ncbi:MAG: metal ABC transporter ATP-binding protein [Phycisphaerales bacterium]|nr:metal ABC transporter ATP-binding protein [Phycisphaerales bacterium]
MTDAATQPLAPAATAALEFDRVCYTYEQAANPAIRDITFRVEPGERLGILGPNGAGKTTLVRIALGLIAPTSGSVRVFGELPAQARAQRWIGYLPQRSRAELAFPLSVRQVVAMPATARLAPWKRPSPEGRAAVERALHLTGCEEFAASPIGRISGGQFQRTMIARALAAQPRILILDEPTIGIDVTGQQRFAEMLSHVQAELGITVVVVTHDLRTVAAGCDRVACLHRSLHAHVSPEGLTPAVLAEVFRHEVEGIFGDVHIDAHRATECRDPAHHPDHTHPHDHAHAPRTADQSEGGTRAHD